MLRHHERIDKSINEANLRLRALRITIERRGDRFALRTILPPKPKSKQDKWTQQRLSLDLRLDLEGVRFAEAKAREISGLLLANAFTWDTYVKHEPGDVEVVKKWGETVGAFSDWYKNTI